ncbi:MAG TPA: MBL fold metallo-hydrolase [Pirellulaceae bacterium]|nr:MBL fold metallo-hydrolase [Pirellulaceae bacterium]HMO92818.1 MBL fold metallo-hydrolase [Pirellulaceae bacterium]HMP69439.1 MBL fold metallo-hydrolase [Pirellulaceae bacterium]
MLLKYFYDQALAHASYLVGCQRTGEAVVVDPGRDIEQYLQVAAGEGVRIVGVAETHIHADYVSGARELAERVGATLYVSDEGPAEWKYAYAKQYAHRLLKDGDKFSIGNVEFAVMHTPGHTPESISFVLTDKGGGADRPMGIFTGDFIFVGSIGRPDLLEEAAGIMGTAEPGARDLFKSMARFRQLPDYLQVWPAHGAGSACGKGLGAIPSSTVGYEKLFNPALQYRDEQAFVDYILAEQPEAPKYFALMKRVNKEGPAVLGGTQFPPRLPANQLLETIADRQNIVVDTVAGKVFANAHVPGTISIETKYIAMWGGSLLDYARPIYLIASQHDLAEVVRILRKIGCDHISGFFDADEVVAAGLRKDSLRQLSPRELAEQMTQNGIELIDVRGLNERHEVMVEGSEHHFLGKMFSKPYDFEDDKTYAFVCRTGGRSVVACSVAKYLGAKNVINVSGGVVAWERAGLPVVKQSEANLQSVD